MKYRKLGNTGLEVSIIGFGGSSLGGVFHDIDEQDSIYAVHEAVDQGVNLIDVSPYYGLTRAEHVLGRALRDIPRHRYLLSTKAGRYGDADFDFSARRIVRSAEESMKRMNVDYLDILHLHDIEFGVLDRIAEESVAALAKLKEQGKVRFTGITGYPLGIFERVLDRVHVDTVISYCHYSLNDTSLLSLLPYFQSKGTGLINASPLSMGLLSDRGAPPWHPADPEIRAVCRDAAAWFQARGKDISRLALQFATAHDSIPTTLVGTASLANLRSNLRWIGEPMDHEDVLQAQRLLQPINCRTWLSGRPENNV